MNYTELEKLITQLPPINYDLQFPMTSINLLGLTPDLFDESVYEILKDYFTEHQYNILATLYKDESLEMLGYADANVVVSAKGLKIAELLKEKYGTPYVVGFPYGRFSAALFMALEQAIETGEDQYPYKDFFRLQTQPMMILKGDPVIMSSIGFSLSQKYDLGYKVVSEDTRTLQPIDLKETKKDDISIDITFPLQDTLFDLTLKNL